MRPSVDMKQVEIHTFRAIFSADFGQIVELMSVGWDCDRDSNSEYSIPSEFHQ